MNSDLTQHVLAVLAYGLDLKDRLNADPSQLPNLDEEHSRLKDLLLAEGAVRGHPDYGDSAPRPVPWDNRDFLGVRYALTCWIDEIFISDPLPASLAWSQRWKERALETEIYGDTQYRADRFWYQADLAEKRPGAEALEAFLWCVMLGFRGNPTAIDPAQWTDRVRRRVLAARQIEFRLPADLNLRTNVPALRGRDRFRLAARLLVVVSALTLFAASAFIAKSF